MQMVSKKEAYYKEIYWRDAWRSILKNKNPAVKTERNNIT